jgi:magnesium chelatase subunit H
VTSAATPLKLVIVSMDTNMAGAAARAFQTLKRDYPGLTLVLHGASEWIDRPEKLQRCRADLLSADIVIAAMLFMEDHFKPVIDELIAAREKADALICLLSAGEVMKLSRMGSFKMDGEPGGLTGLLKRLRGGSKDKPAGAGAQQMKMLKRLPQILRFIPGTAQDVRAYFLALQYWLAGSDDNLANLMRMVIDRYAAGPRKALRGRGKVAPPVDYPETGIYHPKLQGRIGTDASKLPRVAGRRATVGLLGLRSYMLAGNSKHYDGVIEALEARGLNVIPAFASGLDNRPAIETYFMKDGRTSVDAVVSLTGFSLIGGPAYNDSRAADDLLTKLDVPYLAAHPAEIQTLEQWGASDRGMLPVESTIMVAIPELDGATGPILFGGRSDNSGEACKGCHRACVFPSGENDRNMQSCIERSEMLAARVDRLIALRQSAKAERKVALVIFNFPPNAGNTGTAAYLAVFESVYRTLQAMKGEGYSVELPENAEALREAVINGNRARYGADANVHCRIPVDDHVRREPWLSEIEAQWGPAPGKHQSDGGTIFVLGLQLGNVFIGVQPAFGYEGDPMRLLFEKGFAPTHAFTAFYRWLREDFGAHAALHFGTHGALEFMPGKQTGLTAKDWPDRLIGDLPNFYLYAANNPSEGAIAKRRGSATLISYLTPPIARSGLYKGLSELKGSIESYRTIMAERSEADPDLLALIQSQAALVDLADAEPAWGAEAGERIDRLGKAILELEYTLIPHGLHVVGQKLSDAERFDMLEAVADASGVKGFDRGAIEAIIKGGSAEPILSLLTTDERDKAASLAETLSQTSRWLDEDHEIPALLRALDARFIRPAPGGDVLQNPAVLPTGRNLHGHDPFRIPSAYAMKDGAKQAEKIIARHIADTGLSPETIAIVLWGTDNLKNEGAPIAQALALMGAQPRFDSYGRLVGASLIPLTTLGRPRIDVMCTLSGIFRDLLPLQIKLLAEAAYLAAIADEPVAQNFIRKHALAHQAEHGGDMATASLRVFGNADGAYGSNVNHLIGNSRWEEEDELAETYTRRKSFAYGVNGKPTQQTDVLNSILAKVDLAYQNLDSVELGVTTVDHYFDTLGGISRAVRRAKGGEAASVYISDQTRGDGVVRTLSEQVSLETRTRMLNPKWYDGMLNHGYEGVRQIEEHISNTVGWSATTGEVQPWVYQQLTQTFMLDPEMRERLASLNPTASVNMANRLLEAHRRNYWNPDEATLEALKNASDDLEDILEGVRESAAA